MPFWCLFKYRILQNTTSLNFKGFLEYFYIIEIQCYSGSDIHYYPIVARGHSATLLIL